MEDAREDGASGDSEDGDPYVDGGGFLGGGEEFLEDDDGEEEAEQQEAGELMDYAGVQGGPSPLADAGWQDDMCFETREPEAALQRAPRLRSVEWYRLRLHERLHPQTKILLHTWVMGAVARKVKSNQSRDDFEETMKAVAAALPEGNLCPTSWHLYEGILGVKSMWDHIYHVCPCSGHLYEHIPATPASYATHEGDCCPLCQHPRFVQDIQGRMRPANWVFYLGVEAAIRDCLFANPNFVMRRGKARGNGEHTFWGSAEANRLDEALEGHFFKAENSPYTIFIDFFETYTFKTHSTGAVLLRCVDLDDESMASSEFCITLMLIPGPKAPAISSPLMHLIAAEFRTLGESGMEVRPVIREGGVLKEGAPFLHRPFLVGLDADQPASQWAGEFTKSALATLSCFFCKFNGVHVSDSCIMFFSTTARCTHSLVATAQGFGGTNAMKFPGYLQGVTATRGMGKGNTYMMGVNDAARRFTHDEQFQRALLAEAAFEENPTTYHTEFGAKRRCVFLDLLPYLDYNNFFRVPIFHNLLLGLVKDFWREALRWAAGGKRRNGNCCDDACFSIPQGRLAGQRLGGFLLTADFNRPFRGLDTLGSWVCEDWARFTEVYSKFLCQQVIGVGLPPLGKQMWGHLRRAVLHYIQPKDYSPAARSAAAINLLEYGKLCEAHAPWRLTCNLHFANCRLSVQEAVLGLTGFMGELWGERNLAPLKAVVRSRAPNEPEKVLANNTLAQAALHVFAAQQGLGPALVLGAELDNEEGGEEEEEEEGGGCASASNVAASSGGDGGGPRPSEDDTGGRVGLQGGGRVPTPENLALIVKGMQTLVREGALALAGDAFAVDPWTEADLSDGGDGLEIFEHSYAFVHATQTITSQAFLRSKTRDSSMVQVTYQGVKHAAQVQFYARVSKEGRRLVRVALCHFYKHEPEHTDDDMGNLLRGGGWNEHERFYPVELESIDTKLMKFTNASGHDFFSSYSFQSKIN